MIEEPGLMLPPELKARVIAAVQAEPSPTRRQRRMRSAFRMLLLVAFSLVSRVHEPGPSLGWEATHWTHSFSLTAPPPEKPLDVSSVGWFDTPP